jgi:hypothetical protein
MPITHSDRRASAVSCAAEDDEDQRAMIATARDPTEEHRLGADIGGAECTAIVGSFQLVDEAGHVLPLLCLVCGQLRSTGRL